MIFRLVFFLFFMTFGVALPVFAQDDNVEINLDTLDGYLPPPMFEQAAPEKTARPTAATKVLETPARIIPPLPERKPAYSGYIRQPDPQINEGALVLQTAQDILRAIEDETLDPAPQPKPVKAPPLPEREPTKIDLSSIQSDSAFEIALPFEAGEVTLNEAQQRIVLQQILIRMQKYDDAYLEIRSYASSPDNTQSVMRRTALQRAQVIEAMLLDKGIPETRIFLLPLGQVPGEQENAAVLSISRH